MNRLIRHLPSLFACAALALGAAGVRAEPGAPDRYEPVPEQFKKNTEKVGLTDRLGKSVQLDLQFVDTSGKNVKLADYFNKGRPVVLQLGYFRCPQICDVISHTLMEAAKGIDLEIGKDYDILFVSIDPTERWQLGQEKKRNYVEEYAKPGAVTGWNFLVGGEAHIAKLADGVGFKYQFVPEQNQYAHPSMLTVLSPNGKVSRYLYGANFADSEQSRMLRLAIIEAGEGKIGSLGDQLLMLCFHWDGYQGKYTPRWMALMRLGGVLTIGIVAWAISRLLIRELRSGRAGRLSTT